MPKLPRLKPKQIIKALRKAGFFISRVSGSHHILYKADKSFPVTVPMHNRELKIGTLRSIIRQAKLSVAEIIKLLK